MKPMQLIDVPHRGREVPIENTLSASAPRCCGADRCGRFSAIEWLLIAEAARGPGISRHAIWLRSLFSAEELLAGGPIAALAGMARLAAQSGWFTPASEMAAFLRAGWCEEQLASLITAVEPAER